MSDNTVKRLALVLALQADIEGMKAANQQREHLNHSVAYTDADFHHVAEQLRELAYKHDDQL